MFVAIILFIFLRSPQRECLRTPVIDSEGEGVSGWCEV